MVVVAVLVAAGVLVACNDTPPETPPAPVAAAWAELDAQARCDSAAGLVTHRDRWPVRCRWQAPSEGLSGQAFPPPEGPPPYDDPHIEVYVTPGQSREQLANAIAHELGHMHHTREPAFAAEWLRARNLPEQTPAEVWTEDYAEVFAALFSPPADRWRAPTPRPSPGALADLRARFFP
jgi:hypothetical protein